MNPADGPLDWSEDGQPRSRLYGDVYFSAEDGLAESRAVFLKGCDLPAAWRGRDQFVVAELGFGTGLNILALLELWDRTRAPGQRLHIFSVEAHPITADQARRALAHWPDIAGLATQLLARWPGQARGVHRVDFTALGATLDVCVAEVGMALSGWAGRADAWFLDGFSPALNPAMWRDEVLTLVGARSAPGARAATFTVAGQVRRGLAAAGFAVTKEPGFGRKRERLAAAFPGTPPAASATRRVAIVGAGIAGASVARAVRALGGDPIVIETQARGAGASGNPAALVTPRLDAGLGPSAELFAQAFRCAVALYEDVPKAILSRGVLQLVSGERDPDRFARIAASDLFEPGGLEVLAPAAASSALGEAVPAGLAQHAALVVDPAQVLAAWAPQVLQAQVHRIDPGPGGWTLRSVDGALIAEADAVILTAGMGAMALATGLDLRPVRGQASWTTTVAEPTPAAAWGGYVLPIAEGLLFGATHDRDDTGVEVRPGDHARNLATLATALPGLAARLGDAPLEGRASIRATTADRLPLAGPASPTEAGVFLLGGFGSRGFSLAPLLAEHVAALALGAPSPLPEPLAALVDPGRFARRAKRRVS